MLQPGVSVANWNSCRNYGKFNLLKKSQLFNSLWAPQRAITSAAIRMKMELNAQQFGLRQICSHSSMRISIFHAARDFLFLEKSAWETKHKMVSRAPVNAGIRNNGSSRSSMASTAHADQYRTIIIATWGASNLAFLLLRLFVFCDEGGRHKLCLISRLHHKPLIFHLNDDL